MARKIAPFKVRTPGAVGRVDAQGRLVDNYPEGTYAFPRKVKFARQSLVRPSILPMRCTLGLPKALRARSFSEAMVEADKAGLAMDPYGKRRGGGRR